MKVLFLTTNKEAPSTKWRVQQFIPHFERAGVECTVQEWPGGMMARMSLAGKAGDYDVVLLQKRLMQKLPAGRLRRHARSLVFELDDVITLNRTSEGTVSESPTKERRFRRVIRMSDAVVASNEYLAEMARRAADDPGKVVVFPTVIDLDRWTPRPAPSGEGPVTIGWVGTAGNLPSLEILKQPLVRLCRRFDQLQVRIVCEREFAMDGVRVVHKKFAAAEEVDDVRSFDVAVAPLVEDPWTRGKLSSKLLAYFAAGLPVVASDVSANRLYVREGENGYLVGTLGQWEERLAKLIEEPGHRAEIGARARDRVEKEFSMASMVPRYLELFERLAAAGNKDVRVTKD